MSSCAQIRDGEWVAVQVNGNAEKKVSVGLRERSYEHFLPTYTIRRAPGSRIPVEMPLFRGYVFCRWASSNAHRIVNIPGVIRIVGAGRLAIAINEDEIIAIRRIVNAKVLSMPWHYLVGGDRVRVACGPLSGLEGVVSCRKRSYLVLNVTLLQRAVAVTIAPEHLVPCVNLVSRIVRPESICSIDNEGCRC